MVSIRCKLVVKNELDKLGLHYGIIELGEVDTKETPTAAQLKILKSALAKSGLELMNDKKAIVIEKVKTIIVEMVHYSEELPNTNFSNYLSKKLNRNYTYLANLFSDVTGTTIEQYIIAHKVEKVKELLLYDELNLSEIAAKLNYSSLAHLSSQFKKTTGLTPTYFKHLKQYKRRIMLENI